MIEESLSVSPRVCCLEGSARMLAVHKWIACVGFRSCGGGWSLSQVGVNQLGRFGRSG